MALLCFTQVGWEEDVEPVTQKALGNISLRKKNDSLFHLFEVVFFSLICCSFIWVFPQKAIGREHAQPDDVAGRIEFLSNRTGEQNVFADYGLLISTERELKNIFVWEQKNNLEF